MTEEKVNRTQEVYDLAYAGNFKKLQTLSNVDYDMVLMGASNASYKLLSGAQSRDEIKAVAPTLTSEQKNEARVLKRIEDWAIKNGACPLFGIQKKYYMEYSKQPVFFSRLIGKKPGDVTRGDRKKAK
jgi:hypothetical protein